MSKKDWALIGAVGAIGSYLLSLHPETNTESFRRASALFGLMSVIASVGPDIGELF